jgi:hypothetical protein
MTAATFSLRRDVAPAARQLAAYGFAALVGAILVVVVSGVVFLAKEFNVGHGWLAALLAFFGFGFLTGLVVAVLFSLIATRWMINRSDPRDHFPAKATDEHEQEPYRAYGADKPSNSPHSHY